MACRIECVGVLAVAMAVVHEKSTRKFIWKYWGYGALLVLIYGWFVAHFGPIPLVGLSMLVTVYMLLQAPVPCCAGTEMGRFVETVDEGCLVDVDRSRSIGGKMRGY